MAILVRASRRAKAHIRKGRASARSTISSPPRCASGLYKFKPRASGLSEVKMAVFVKASFIQEVCTLKR